MTSFGECAPKTHQKGTPIGIFKPNCRNLKIAISSKFDNKTQTINDTLWVNLPLPQDAMWYGGRPRTRPHCVRWGSSFPPSKNKGHSSPQFSAHVFCGQTAGWTKMKHGMDLGLGPDHIVLDGDDRSPLSQRGTAPNFGPCLLWPNGRPSHLLLSTC